MAYSAKIARYVAKDERITKLQYENEKMIIELGKVQAKRTSRNEDNDEENSENEAMDYASDDDNLESSLKMYHNKTSGLRRNSPQTAPIQVKKIKCGKCLEIFNSDDSLKKQEKETHEGSDISQL